MKLTKKLASLALAIVLVLALSTSAFAADPGTGSITINGVSTDYTYAIYRLLDLESYDTEAGAYSYTVNADWTGFFATEDALKYVDIDDDDYVTWNPEGEDATVASFAKLALSYAQDHNINPVESSEKGDFVIDGDSGTFKDLALGYYLVDSTMGALCGLTTTEPDASIEAKNGVPAIDKQVREDSTTQWGDNNTADIGQIVEYRVTINAHAGAQNYVLHDKMSAGLTFQEVSEVKCGTSEADASTVDASNYTVVTEDLDDGCTFEVHFTQDFCDSLETDKKIFVYYSAMLNSKAIIATEENTNEAWLEFGEEHSTNHDSVYTKTYGFDIVKTDSDNKLIDGAEFKIYDAATGGKEVAVVQWISDEPGATWDDHTYRRASADETGVSIVVKDGKIRVVGLDNGTYYLEETVAPAGYNKLTARQEFKISDGNLDAEVTDGSYSNGGVQVVNKTGSMFPETGGIGRTIFYVGGGLLVAGAVVLLITKKRMGADA